MKDQKKLLEIIWKVVEEKNAGNENCYAEYITLHDIEDIIGRSLGALDNIEEPEEKKMTIDELREQFDEMYCNSSLDLSWNSMDKLHNDKTTRILWGGYYRCALKNNLVEK